MSEKRNSLTECKIQDCSQKLCLDDEQLTRKTNFMDLLLVFSVCRYISPIALIKAKILNNFDLSERKRVKLQLA